MRFRFIKPHGIDHQWPGRFFGPGQGWLQLILCRSAQLQDLMDVLVEPTHLKNMRVKLDPFPKVLGVKIRKTFETT